MNFWVPSRFRKDWVILLQNLHSDLIGQIYGGEFVKICGLLRIYELYRETSVSFIDFQQMNHFMPSYSIEVLIEKPYKFWLVCCKINLL